MTQANNDRNAAPTKPSDVQTLAAWIANHSKADTGVKRASMLETVPLVVADIAAAAGSEFSSVIGRFNDLGLCAGETFEYFGRAPLGEPVYICVRETVLALRMEEAALIFVARDASKGDRA